MLRNALPIVLLLGAFASAQIEPEAAERLQCAAERHGLASGGLRNVADEGTITYFGPTGEPVARLDVQGLIDIENQRLRVDFFIGEMRVLAQQLAGGEGFIYAPDSGAVALPRSERENLQRTFFSSAYALLPSVVHQSARVTPESPFFDTVALRIDLVTEGVEHALFLDEACTLIGSLGTEPDLGETLTHYLENRSVDGYLISFRADLYAMGMRIGTVETLTATINTTLDEARFEVP
jgi:hypothetical protein